MYVYSCLAGREDDPRWILSSRVPGVLFTDQPVAHSGLWTVKPLARRLSDSRLTSRWHKLHSHLLFDGPSLWIDSCLRILSYPDCRQPLMTFRHPVRNCVYHEFQACLRLGKDRPAVMHAQMERYRQAGMPAGWGLAETTVLYREPQLAAFNRQWWFELVAGSVRDQLSFPYVAYRSGWRSGIIPGWRERAPGFEFRPHKCSFVGEPGV